MYPRYRFLIAVAVAALAYGTLYALGAPRPWHRHHGPGWHSYHACGRYEDGRSRHDVPTMAPRQARPANPAPAPPDAQP